MIKDSDIESEALKCFKEAEDTYREWLHKPVHTGSGLIEQITRGV
jgi:hypothetical protein